jgi:hypothetical protein
MSIDPSPTGDGDPDQPLRVRLDGDHLSVDGLRVRDADLCRIVAEHDDADRPALIVRALKVGLLALAGASTTINVDYVQREFDQLLRRVHDSQEAATEALEQSLRETFGDGDGRLPRTLESFLGERGTLRRLVDDLFDEERRDSAIGRMRTLLGSYFDGDGALLARLLDPTRDGSPLHSFRTEVREGLSTVADRLSRLEEGRTVRAEERSLGTAKGTDFEDVVEERVTVIAHGCGDLLERTGTVEGDTLRGKKGDLVLHLAPASTRGVEVRVAIEVKNRRLGITPLVRELEAARRNRGAEVAVAVFAPGCAPTGCAPLTLYGEDVICELDPESDDTVALTAAVRLARALALATARQRSVDIDTGTVRAQLESVRNRIKAVQGMKAKLTSIAGAAQDVSGALDELRAGVIDCVVAIETALCAGLDTTAAA